MKYHKTVLMPIEVTVGDYCRGSHRICAHFNNEERNATCDLGFDITKTDKEGRYIKPLECKILKNEN